MMNLDFDATQIATIYNGGSSEVRAMIKEKLGDMFSTVLPITSRVKDFDSAYAELGDEHPCCKEYRSAKYGYSSIADNKELMAFYQLRVIIAALNEGKEPRYDGIEERCYPDIVYNEEDDQKCWVEVTYEQGRKTSHPKGLALLDRELALYAGETFMDLYKVLYLGIETEDNK